MKTKEIPGFEGTLENLAKINVAEKQICQDFYFYPNGEYTTKSKWVTKLYSFDNDLSEISTHIRIYGTDEEIDKSLDEYCEKTNLNLDECFDYKIESVASRWYNPTQNIQIEKDLIRYAELYNKMNGGLIINMK